MKFKKGDVVECLCDSFGGGFIEGARYVVAEDHDGEDGGHERSLVIETDSKGSHRNGWQAKNFKKVHSFVGDEQGTVLGTQVGGDHYTRQKIQPIEYVWANNLGFSEGNIVKYITRWKFKGGIKDLKKAHHHLALLIEEAERAEREDGVKYGLQSDPR